ncbi:MAG TPA: hypothetical protein VHJ37_11305 [Thermoleophilaceae bacterium]|nr:hypothetical protein [Thermoleophilaceae bacterium]
MSDDRFGDLGGGGDGQREDRTASIGERLAERDRTHPEPVRPPAPPRSTNKYAWAVGILFVMVLSVLLFVETLPDQGEALLGPKPGSTLKEFAAPSALGDLEGDVNLCQSRPCPEGVGEDPACEVVSPDVVNLCELRRRPLVLTFIFDRGADCYPQVDRVERVSDDFPGVEFATVFFSRDKSKDEIGRLVQARGWTQPVAIDRDGGLSNVYGIGVCPTTIFARQGGKVVDVELGNLTEGQLRRRAQRLES